MDNQNRFQPPYFDLNNLDEDHEIVFDYDENGNLRRIRKVNRYRGFATSVLLLIILFAMGMYVLSGS